MGHTKKIFKKTTIVLFLSISLFLLRFRPDTSPSEGPMRPTNNFQNLIFFEN